MSVIELGEKQEVNLLHNGNAEQLKAEAARLLRFTESDPNGKNQHEPGAKMDAGKAPIVQGVLQYFPRALEAVSLVSLAGAKKYAWKGWEKVPDGINRYENALGRHILVEAVEGPIDKDTKCLHKAQVAWNALAALELYLREQETTKQGNLGGL